METKKFKSIKKTLLIIIAIISLGRLQAQTPNSVGIGTTNPDNSAILHLESSNQGFLMTRLTTTQINAIVTPTVGLIIYNTVDQCYWYKRPGYWARLCNTDSINASSVITNTFHSDTTFTNVNNFGNGYGDSIWVHYASIDTAIINNLTVHTINADSIYLGGNSITTVITDSITKLAWLLKGNSGTNPAINFLGTIDNQDLVVRTNNTEKIRVTAPGNVGIGTSVPHSSAILELKGTDKGFLMTTLTTAQINAIVTPTVGLITYNTDDNCYWYKHPYGWKRICNTDSLGNVFISTLTTNTINAQTINTSTINASAGSFTTITTNSLTTNVYNFGNGIGDSIWVHYAEIDTAYIHQLTVNTINADSIYLGGNSITTVITDSITNLAWLLKGNTGTNPAINFLGTKDNQDLVFRTANTEKARLTNTGNFGVGVIAPTTKLEVGGTTKTTQFQMTFGAVNGYILQSNNIGMGFWTPPASVVSVLTPTVFNTNAWTLLGNSGTNPTINFLGTTDNQRLVFRTNNVEKVTILPTGETGFGTPTPTNKVEVIGNTKTTNFQMTAGAVNTYILQSNALGNGSWVDPSALISTITSTLSPGTFNSNAWTLLGNSGTNPTVNFVGTTDFQRLVFRTNNAERATITTSGDFGIGVPAPTNRLEVNGNTKTTNFQMTNGATLNYILQSNAAGNGTWVNPSTLVSTITSTLSPGTFNSNAWTLLGNSGTNPAVNFIGTTDNQGLTVRTNSVQVMYFNTNGQLYANAAIPGNFPQYSFNGYFTSGLYHYAATTGTVSGLRMGINKSGWGSIINSDEFNNTYIHYQNPSSYISNGGNNFSVGAAQYDATSVNNFNHGHNRFINARNTFVVNNTPAVANILTDVFNSSVIGQGNSVTNGQNFYVFGANNILTNTNQTKTSVFGNDIRLSYAAAVAIGNGNPANEAGFVTGGTTIIGTAGLRVYSNSNYNAGVTLAMGGGAWASISDRKMKENITEISNKTILDKIMSVPVTEWTYLSQKVDSMNKYAPEGIHYDKAPVHIGPMAQDFSEIFGYGEFKDKITTSDIDGVMFSGIQALAEENKQLKAKIEKLEAVATEIEELKKLVNDLKNR